MSTRVYLDMHGRPVELDPATILTVDRGPTGGAIVRHASPFEPTQTIELDTTVAAVLAAWRETVRLPDWFPGERRVLGE